jgi:hypothetical protein
MTFEEWFLKEHPLYRAGRDESQKLAMKRAWDAALALAPKPAPARARIGASVSDGGRGVFPADIHCIGNVNVVVANRNLGGINYDGIEPTHVFIEVPNHIYMSKERGIFVVPAGQLKEVAT